MITALTDAQRARFPHYIERWKRIGLATGPIDRKAHDAAIADVYRLAKLDPPRMIYVPCPLSGALAAAVYQAIVRSAVRSAVDSAVYSAVNSAVDSAVDSAVNSAVDSAVYSAVHSAVHSAVGSAVYSAVHSAVGSAVDSAVHSAVDSAVNSAVHSAVYSAVHSAVDSARQSWVYWLWGNQWAGYAAWAEFFREECAVVDVSSSCLAMMEHGHYTWPFRRVCFASKRPVAIHVDAQGRSHREAGPAVEYSTGWGPYCWHGTVIPPVWHAQPPSAVDALKWPNMEQRRAACEIVGWANILRELHAVTIDKHENPMAGELLEVEIPDVGREKFLRVMCATQREFALPVPPEMQSVEQAQRWLNFLPDEVPFIPTVRC